MEKDMFLTIVVIILLLIIGIVVKLNFDNKDKIEETVSQAINVEYELDKENR